MLCLIRDWKDTLPQARLKHFECLGQDQQSRPLVPTKIVLPWRIIKIYGTGILNMHRLTVHLISGIRSTLL